MADCYVDNCWTTADEDSVWRSWDNSDDSVSRSYKSVVKMWSSLNINSFISGFRCSDSGTNKAHRRYVHRPNAHILHVQMCPNNRSEKMRFKTSSKVNQASTCCDSAATLSHLISNVKIATVLSLINVFLCLEWKRPSQTRWRCMFFVRVSSSTLCNLRFMSRRFSSPLSLTKSTTRFRVNFSFTGDVSRSERH